jgi:hypothetical protein
VTKPPSFIVVDAVFAPGIFEYLGFPRTPLHRHVHAHVILLVSIGVWTGSKEPGCAFDDDGCTPMYSVSGTVSGVHSMPVYMHVRHADMAENRAVS